MEIKRVGSQASAKGSPEWFTGAVRVDPLFQAPEPAFVSGASVMEVWDKETAFESACPTSSNVEVGASGFLFWFAISFLAHRLTAEF